MFQGYNFTNHFAVHEARIEEFFDIFILATHPECITHIHTLTPTGSLKSKTRPTAPHPRSLQQRHYIITHEAACAYNSSLLRGPLSPLALRSPVQFSPLSLPRKRSSSKEERDCTLSLSHTYTLHLPTHPCI